MKWARYATRADYQADMMLTGKDAEWLSGQVWAKVGAGKMWAMVAGGGRQPHLVRRRPGTDFCYEIATEQEP